MPGLPLLTPRLRLRSIALADADDLAERRSDEETARFQAWSAPYPADRARTLVEEVTRFPEPTPGHWFQFVAELLSDGRVAGDIGVHLSPDGHTAELGYTLHGWARGHGYATEAVGRVIDYLVDERRVHRIEGATDPRNGASIRVLQRLGFTAEGVKRESYWLEDEVTDDAFFGLLAREWVARRP